MNSVKTFRCIVKTIAINLLLVAVIVAVALLQKKFGYPKEYVELAKIGMAIPAILIVLSWIVALPQYVKIYDDKVVISVATNRQTTYRKDYIEDTQTYFGGKIKNFQEEEYRRIKSVKKNESKIRKFEFDVKDIVGVEFRGKNQIWVNIKDAGYIGFYTFMFDNPKRLREAFVEIQKDATKRRCFYDSL